MQKQAVQGFKRRDSLVTNVEGHEVDEKACPVKLAVIKEKSDSLLDKEATCCNLATD